LPVDHEELIAEMDNSELKELLIAKFSDRLEPDMSARREGLNTAERHADIVACEKRRQARLAGVSATLKPKEPEGQTGRTSRHSGRESNRGVTPNRALTKKGMQLDMKKVEKKEPEL
jgi:hypothetical protein